MLEVEAKYRSPGNEKVEKALVRLGAKKIAEESVEDVYFSHPTKDFGKTDEALRLRKTAERSEVSYKGPRIATDRGKAREEINIIIDDPLNAQRIVERLGFKEVLSIKKRRISYILDKLRVDIDDVEGLGEFVELEALTESPDRTAQLFDEATAELALDKLEPRTYLEMMLDKKESQK